MRALKIITGHVIYNPAYTRENKGEWFGTQIREQMLVLDLYVFTLKFHLNFSLYKKRQKHEKKISQKRNIFFTFILCNFSVRML